MRTLAESFAALTDEELLSEVQVLVARERDATTVLIVSLGELDARQLYLPLGYPSLFAYCVGELHMSKSAACSRMHAARVIRAFPAALKYLADGSITLTNLNVLGPHLTVDNHEELLRAAKSHTKEEVERQMAALSPGAPDLVTIHLRVRVQTRDKLRRAQDLWRQAGGGATADILDRALTLLVADLEKKKLANVTRPRRARKIAPSSRYIPAWLRRAVTSRDGNQCKFMGTARRCPETAALQVHHVIPHEYGGLATLENLELRCPAHNQYEAKLDFPVIAPTVRERPPRYGSYGRPQTVYLNSS